MLKNIKDILNNSKEIDGWKIIESRIEASELFFVKKELDMNRAKDVHHIQVTVYKDFEENGVKYRGSSTTKIHPSNTTSDIKKVIEDVSFAAGFVKNKYYPLVQPSNESHHKVENKFLKEKISYWLPELTEAIFKEDTFKKGWINSAELFLNKFVIRIINSEGLEVSYDGFKGMIEFITNWTEDGEEIELYKEINFSDYNPDSISSDVKNMLLISKDKANAKPTPHLKKSTVLLTGEAVRRFFNYYYSQTNAKNRYEKISTVEIDENIQGKDVKGDLISLELDPFMKDSVYSSPYDGDGYPLKPVTIIKDGVVKRYWGDVRYSYYLDIKPTGDIKNVRVKEGSISIEEFRKDPHFEIIAFSDFQVDPLTGDFGGEIRLGWYHDGKNRIPVTGGSISGNIKEVHNEMYLSKEVQQINNYVGPKTIKLFNISVSGN